LIYQQTLLLKVYSIHFLVIRNTILKNLQSPGPLLDAVALVACHPPLLVSNLVCNSQTPNAFRWESHTFVPWVSASKKWPWFRGC
jgi:hypothetical protein